MSKPDSDKGVLCPVMTQSSRLPPTPAVPLLELQNSPPAHFPTQGTPELQVCQEEELVVDVTKKNTSYLWLRISCEKMRVGVTERNQDLDKCPWLTQAAPSLFHPSHKSQLQRSLCIQPLNTSTRHPVVMQALTSLEPLCPRLLSSLLWWNPRCGRQAPLLEGWSTRDAGRERERKRERRNVWMEGRASGMEAEERKKRIKKRGKKIHEKGKG